MVQSFRAAVAEARRHGDLYFAALLPADRILKAVDAARSFWQGWIYSPAVTVWVFLSQCLSPDHSCREAVARLIAWRVSQGLRPCSAETGAYCAARSDLPEDALHGLLRDTGKESEEVSPEAWLWQGRKVRVVDGSTVTMPDTPENQAAYPAEEIALLYRRRWQAELHLRSLKIVLQMDHLRCKTPERVRNEFWTHLLGYNLIRGVMAAAAVHAGRSPWEISFKGTLQTLSEFLPLLLTQVGSDAWCLALLIAVATHIVADRPDRFEPRLRKRRPKPYKHLREHRRNYKL